MTWALNPYGVWRDPGVIFRAPDDYGPKEALVGMKQNGYRWAAFDPKTGDHFAERWTCDALGIEPRCWTQIRNAADIILLTKTAKAWRCPMLVNIEKPESRDIALCRTAIASMGIIGKAAVISDGWLDLGDPHSPSAFAMGLFKRWVGMVECFPQANPALTDVNGCLEHAAPFFRAVIPCLGTYAGWPSPVMKPEKRDYLQHQPAAKIRSPFPSVLFTGDDIEDWGRWPA